MSTEPRWFFQPGWGTAHLIRPGVTRKVKGHPVAVTVCGRAMPGPLGMDPNCDRCGQCTRRTDNDENGTP